MYKVDMAEMAAMDSRGKLVVTGAMGAMPLSTETPRQVVSNYLRFDRT
jgi:hypothetical protein